MKVQFGLFEFDQDTLELRKRGILIRLQSQPAKVLSMLLEHHGDVVTREDLQAALWSQDALVDFEIGLNTAVRKIRTALNDPADTPRFIRTIPKVGYSFIAPMQTLGATPPVAPIEAPPVVPPPVAPAAPQWRWRIAMAAIALLGLGRIVVWPRLATPSKPAAPLHLAISLPAGQTLATGGRSLDISPDGRQIVYSATSGGHSMLFRRALDDFAAATIPGTEKAMSPLFSPDGQRLVFWQDGAIVSIQLDGAGRRELVRTSPDVTSPFLAWGEHGDLFFTGLSKAGLPAMFRLPGGNGRPSLVLGDLRTPAGLEFPFPQQVIDNDTLLYSSAVTPQSRSIGKISLDTGQRTELAPHAMGGRYLPTGHLIYYWNSAIWAAAFDPARTQPPITGVQVISGVAPASWTGPQAAISRDGSLAYVAEPQPEERILEWAAANGRREPLPAPPAAYEPIAVNSRGTRILVSRGDAGGRWSLWSYEAARATWTHLIDGAGGNRPAGVWIDDDTIVASSQGAEEFANLVRISVSTPDQANPLMPRKNRGQYVASWSPVWKAIAYVEGVDPETKSDIWVLPLDGGGTPVAFVREPGWQSHPDFSPDGQWLAYDSGEGNERAVYVKPYPKGGAGILVGRGAAPVWSADGRTLYFREGSSEFAVSWNSGRPTNQRVVFEGKYLGPDLWTRRCAFDAHTGRFLMARLPSDGARPAEIRIVVDWFAELKRLVPAVR